MEGPAPGGAADEVPLDGDMLKVLASDTRRDILRLLKTRRMTVTELSEALDLQKSTLLEHLKKLTDAGLVRRHEDERLWVYYDLSPHGGRLVTPGRSRFYLVLGFAAAAALLLGAVVTAGLVLDDAEPEPFRVRVTDDGTPLGLRIHLPPGVDAEGARVLLLAPEDVHGFLAGATPPDAALDVATTPTGALRVAYPMETPPGTYAVYVSTASGDNRDRLAYVTIPPFDLDGPDVVWRHLSDASGFHLGRDGALPEGALTLEPRGTGEPEALLPLEAGEARLGVDVLDALRERHYDVVWHAPAREESALAPATGIRVGALEVREADVGLSPLQMRAGGSEALRIHLASPDGRRPDFGLATVAGTERRLGTGENGTFVVHVLDAPAGGFDVQLGRLPPMRVATYPSVVLDVERVEGALVLTPWGDAFREPDARAEIILDGRSLGNATAEQSSRTPLPDEGAHTLAVALPGSPLLVLDLHVGENLTVRPMAPAVRDVLASSQGGRLEGTVAFATPPANLTTTLEVLVGGRVVHTAEVSFPEAGNATRGVTYAAWEAETSGVGLLEVEARVLPAARPLVRVFNGSFLDAPVNISGASVDVWGLPLVSPTATATPAMPTGEMPAPQVPGPDVALVLAALVLALAARRARRR